MQDFLCYSVKQLPTLMVPNVYWSLDYGYLKQQSLLHNFASYLCNIWLSIILLFMPRYHKLILHWGFLPKNLHVFWIFPMHITCSYHLYLLDLTIVAAWSKLKITYEACIDKTNKTCCGWQQHICQFNMIYNGEELYQKNKIMRWRWSICTLKLDISNLESFWLVIRIFWADSYVFLSKILFVLLF